MATRWIIIHPTPEKALHPSFTPGQQVTIVRDAEPNNFCEVQMFESGELARLPWCCLAPSSWYHGLMTPAMAERELRLQRKSHSSRSSGSGTPLSPVAGGSPAQNTAGVFLIRTDDIMQQLVLSLSTDTEVHHFPITVCALGFSLACDTSSVFPTLMTLVEYFSVASGPLPCTLKAGVPFLPFSLRQPSAKSLASAAASLSHHPPAATLSPVGCPHLCTDRFFSLLFSEAFRGRDLMGVTLALPHHLGVHISVLLSLLQQFPNHTSALVAAELIEPVTASLCNLMLADYRAVRNLQLDSQPLVAPATCYLSHNPGSSFRTLVDAAVQYDNKHSHANNYFWVDFLCQYGPIPSDMCTDTDPDTTPSRFVPFGEAPAKTHVFLTSSAVPPTQVAAAATPGPPTISELVRAIGTVTLVGTPTSAPAALNHPSCLREMFAALETSVHLRITLSSSELSFFKAAMFADARALFSSFVNIDIGLCAEALSLEPVVDGDRGDVGGGAGGDGGGDVGGGAEGEGGLELDGQAGSPLTSDTNMDVGITGAVGQVVSGGMEGEGDALLETGGAGPDSMEYERQDQAMDTGAMDFNALVDAITATSAPTGTDPGVTQGDTLDGHSPAENMHARLTYVLSEWYLKHCVDVALELVSTTGITPSDNSSLVTTTATTSTNTNTEEQATRLFESIYSVLCSIDDSALTIKILEKCLERQSQYLGEHHRATVATCDRLAHAYEESGEVDMAVEYTGTVLQHNLMTSGEMHVDTADTYARVGRLCVLQGDLPAALDALRRCVTLREALLGDAHRDTIAAYDQLAQALLMAGDVSTAEQLFQKALHLKFAGPLPRDSASLASSYLALGRICLQRLDLDLAIDYFNRVLQFPVWEIQAETVGALSGLADAHTHKDDEVQALFYATKALENAILAFGDTSPRTASATNTLAMALLAADRKEEAVAEFRVAMERAVLAYGETHPETLQIRMNLEQALADVVVS